MGADTNVEGYMPTHVITQTLAAPEASVSQPVTSTGSGPRAVIDSVVTATTDQLVDVSFTLAALKSIFILSDQAIQIETNATNHAGGDIIQIQANVPLVWQSGGYFTNPFAFDVTKFYLTNTSGSTANYTICWLVDGTP